MFLEELKVLKTLVFYTHTHTHTHITPAEKNFKSWYKEATNGSSWSKFLCSERLWIATPLARNDEKKREGSGKDALTFCKAKRGMTEKRIVRGMTDG